MSRPAGAQVRLGHVIVIPPKQAVVDPPGKTVQSALARMGCTGIVAVALVLNCAARAATESDIPAVETQDAVMAPEEEVLQVADWADARFVMAAGGERWLDEGRANVLLQAEVPPFSFTYAGKASGPLLASWPRTVQRQDYADRSEQRVRWQDPETGLAVSAVLQTFKGYPAADLCFASRIAGPRTRPSWRTFKPWMSRWPLATTRTRRGSTSFGEIPAAKRASRPSARLCRSNRPSAWPPPAGGLRP